MAELPPQTIYTITHCGLSGLNHIQQVEKLLAGGARLIQVRDKENLGTQRLEFEVRRCVELCRAAGATLIVNDDPRLCMLAGAHGVHLGQGDMPPMKAREITGPDKIIGLSTHNHEQFDAALREPVDYIAVGPIYGTTTKKNADPTTGLELVRYAARKLNGAKPLVAIGGITKMNLAELVGAHRGVYPAMIGEIIGRRDITAAYRDVRETFERALAAGS